MFTVGVDPSTTSHSLEIRTALDDDLVDRLATLLIDVVDGGASVSSLPPLDHDMAMRFWRELARHSNGIMSARANTRRCRRSWRILAPPQAGSIVHAQACRSEGGTAAGGRASC